MKAFIINLQRSADRRQSMLENIAKLESKSANLANRGGAAARI